MREGGWRNGYRGQTLIKLWENTIFYYAELMLILILKGRCKKYAYMLEDNSDLGKGTPFNFQNSNYKIMLWENTLASEPMLISFRDA